MAAHVPATTREPLTAELLAKLKKEQELIKGLLDVNADGDKWKSEKSPLGGIAVWSRDMGTSVKMYRARGKLPASPANTVRALIEREVRGAGCNWRCWRGVDGEVPRLTTF